MGCDVRASNHQGKIGHRGETRRAPSVSSSWSLSWTGNPSGPVPLCSRHGRAGLCESTRSNGLTADESSCHEKLTSVAWWLHGRQGLQIFILSDRLATGVPTKWLRHSHADFYQIRGASEGSCMGRPADCFRCPTPTLPSLSQLRWALFRGRTGREAEGERERAGHSQTWTLLCIGPCSWYLWVPGKLEASSH